MAGEAKAGAGRPARRRGAESQVTDDASRGQPERRPEAEPLQFQPERSASKDFVIRLNRAIA